MVIGVFYRGDPRKYGKYVCYVGDLKESNGSLVRVDKRGVGS